MIDDYDYPMSGPSKVGDVVTPPWSLADLWAAFLWVWPAEHASHQSLLEHFGQITKS